MTFSLSSPKFQDHAEIPIEYTREGRDVSPPLAWHAPPAGTVSFALVCEDPDAPDPAHPQRTFVHWVVYNLPSTLSSLPEGAGSTDAKIRGPVAKVLPDRLLDRAIARQLS